MLVLLMLTHLSLRILLRHKTATRAAMARAVIADTQAMIIHSVCADGNDLGGSPVGMGAG